MQHRLYCLPLALDIPKYLTDQNLSIIVENRQHYIV